MLEDDYFDIFFKLMERNMLRISALYHLSISLFEPGAVGKDPKTDRYEVI